MENNFEKWLKRAKSNLKIAKTKKDKDIYYEDLCFEAQQCVEKALKALLLYLNEEIPKFHSFHILLAKLEKHIEIPDDIKDVTELTDYAVQTRYPGDYTPLSKQEYQRAVEVAEIVLRWVEKTLNK